MRHVIPRLGTPTPSSLNGEVSTTEPAGKCCIFVFTIFLQRVGTQVHVNYMVHVSQILSFLSILTWENSSFANKV